MTGFEFIALAGLCTILILAFRFDRKMKKNEFPGYIKEFHK